VGCGGAVVAQHALQSRDPSPWLTESRCHILLMASGYYKTYLSRSLVYSPPADTLAHPSIDHVPPYELVLPAAASARPRSLHARTPSRSVSHRPHSRFRLSLYSDCATHLTSHRHGADLCAGAHTCGVYSRIPAVLMRSSNFLHCQIIHGKNACTAPAAPKQGAPSADSNRRSTFLFGTLALIVLSIIPPRGHPSEDGWERSRLDWEG